MIFIKMPLWLVISLACLVIYYVGHLDVQKEKEDVK
ncbi:hypothetical protein J2Z80_000261 [Thermoanaerobacterium butyriciformans]|uniref:Uncharacterized protein n=1 Tax=Thermoanaerobacterium butyriciformans TaxID=1702242 RepID=A0ABS4NCM9_9THEO|nr:hypothetical protein [Thermoanaerobacterium butyriciformans]